MQHEIERLSKVLKAETGDPYLGKKLFTAQCAKCHTLFGQGGQIGPDLSMIGKKASRENLFESILLPSKAVADQYVTWIVETGKGQTLTGLIVEDTAEAVTIRDANGNSATENTVSGSMPRSITMTSIRDIRS